MNSDGVAELVQISPSTPMPRDLKLDSQYAGPSGMTGLVVKRPALGLEPVEASTQPRQKKQRDRCSPFDVIVASECSSMSMMMTTMMTMTLTTTTPLIVLL